MIEGKWLLSLYDMLSNTTEFYVFCALLLLNNRSYRFEKLATCDFLDTLNAKLKQKKIFFFQI